MSHDDLNVKIESTEVDIFVDRTTDVEITVDILPDVMVSVPPEELNITVDAREIDIRIDNQPPDIELTLTSLPDVIVLPTTGLTGPMGPKGLTGDTGPRGLTGPEGAQGIKGDTGSQGTQGPIGAAGPQGQTGPQGAASTVPGPVGPVGPMGTVYDSDQIGTIKAWSCPVIPENWALGLGQTVNRVDYPDYADELGIPAGQATFQFPNLSEKFLYGAATTAEIGQTGGEAAVTLTAGQMPIHSHTVNSHSHGGLTGSGNSGTVSAWHTHGVGMDAQGSHSHTMNTGLPIAVNALINAAAIGTARTSVEGEDNMAAAGSHTHNAWTGDPSANHTHTVPQLSITAEAPGTDNKGSGLAHNNMPPWVKVGWIVKVTGAQIDTAGNLVGATGAQGPQGIKGDTGNTGATGATGPQGVPGYTEICCQLPQGYSGTVSCANGLWTQVPIPAPPTLSITKSDGTNDDYTRNADGSVTINKAGLYHIDALASEIGTAWPDAASINFGLAKKNGALPTTSDWLVVGQYTSGSVTNNYPSCPVSCVIQCAVGDRIAGWLWHNSGAARNICLRTFSITRMGAGPAGPAGAQGPAGGPANQVTPTYAVTAGYTVDRAFNPEATSLTEVARVLGSLISDMKTSGLMVS